MWPRRGRTLLIYRVLIVLAVLVFLLMHAIPSDMFTDQPARIDKKLTSTPSRIDKGLTSTPARDQTGLIFTGDNESSQAKMLRTDQPPNERKPRNEDTAERGDDVVAGSMNLSSPYVISWEEHNACMKVDERQDRQQTGDVKLIVYWQDDEHFPETSFDDLYPRPDTV